MSDFGNMLGAKPDHPDGIGQVSAADDLKSRDSYCEPPLWSCLLA